MRQDLKDEKRPALGKDDSRQIILFRENTKYPNARMNLICSMNEYKFVVVRVELGTGRVVRKIGRCQVR